MQNKQLFLKTAAILAVAVICVFGQNSKIGPFQAGPLTWQIQNSVLTITGEGDMPNYGETGSHAAPWAQYKTQIAVIEIGDEVTSIGSAAFYEHSYTFVVNIGKSVKSIGASAFYNCRFIEGLILPNSVETIGRMAFNNCDFLAGELIIPNSVTLIDDNAFTACSLLTKLTLGSSVETIGKLAFNGCKRLAGDLIIPESVSQIYAGAFFSCGKLTGTLTVPNATIGMEAFGRCGFSSVTLGANVPSIGVGAFYYCNNLTSFNYNCINADYTYDDYEERTDEGLFKGSYNLTQLNIGDGVTNIPGNTFLWCRNIKELDIPASVTEIGSTAFWGWEGLTKITNRAPMPQTIVSEAFKDVNMSNVKLYVSAEALGLYQTTNVWKNFDVAAIGSEVYIMNRVAANKIVSISFAGIENGQINVNLKAGEYVAELYNIQGRLVGNVNINATHGVNATRLKTDNLGNGMFILNVKQAGVSVLKQKIKI
ncbi:MAG: leucine-rich repeat protein [Chitinispirillales bacterium]|jgi:hypothetical protein|nr:leucine-rich repeat protein [Chitinispirillales bacterium]